uniref:CRAL-TRIO domain-containing protein n=1 Tax=Rhabditophanes sp. KR3021 TaxID=114890 RepID=A0AC35TQI1_9BILA
MTAAVQDSNAIKVSKNSTKQKSSLFDQGTKDSLTEKQVCGISKLRTLLASELASNPKYGDDFSLLRWLNGHNYDFEIIVPKFKHALDVLRMYQADKYDLTSIEKVSEAVLSFGQQWHYYPGGIMGFDRSGNVIVMQPLGKADSRGLIKSGKISCFYESMIIDAEGTANLLRLNESKYGKKLGIIIMVDLADFKMDVIYMPALKIFGNLLLQLQDLFPDMVKEINIINCPSVIAVIFGLISSFLSKQTKEKITFFGSDWKTKLFDKLGDENILEHWGGKARIANSGTGLVRMGGEIPDELLYKNCEHYGDKELSKLIVKPKNTEIVTFKVRKPETKVKWWFTCEGGEILFKIIKHTEKNEEVVWPKIRITTEFVPEFNEIIFNTPATYSLSFENDSNFFWNRTIKYSIEIEE